MTTPNHDPERRNCWVDLPDDVLRVAMRMLPEPTARQLSEAGARQHDLWERDPTTWRHVRARFAKKQAAPFHQWYRYFTILDDQNREG